MTKQMELMRNREQVKADYFKLIITDYTPKELSDEELNRLYHCMNVAYLHDWTNTPLWCIAQAVLEVEDPTNKYMVLDYAAHLIA